MLSNPRPNGKCILRTKDHGVEECELIDGLMRFPPQPNTGVMTVVNPSIQLYSVRILSGERSGDEVEANASDLFDA